MNGTSCTDNVIEAAALADLEAALDAAQADPSAVTVTLGFTWHCGACGARDGAATTREQALEAADAHRRECNGVRD